MAYHSLPEALLRARAARGHTQPQAAAAIGVSVRTWKSWESEGAEPRANKLQALAAYAGLGLTALVRLVQHDAAASTVSDDAQPIRSGDRT